MAFALALRPGLLSRVLGRSLRRPHPAHRVGGRASVLGGAPAPTHSRL
ncbi:MAG: hypothetical protein ACLTMP_05920 [Eggerthella lenta]